MIIDLEKLNKDLDEYLVGVQSYSQEVSNKMDLPATSLGFEAMGREIC